MAVRGWIRTGAFLSATLVAPALAACSGSSSPSSSVAPETSSTVDIFVAMGRREPNDCPTAAPLQQDAPGKPFVASLGPVAMSFAPESIDSQSRVRADFSYRFNGLVIKLPFIIRGTPDAPVTIRGSEIASGHPVKYEGYGTEGEYVELASFALKFVRGSSALVPGAMLFPEPGCYQIFVTVDNVEYGPFGLLVQTVS